MFILLFNSKELSQLSIYPYQQATSTCNLWWNLPVLLCPVSCYSLDSLLQAIHLCSETFSEPMFSFSRTKTKQQKAHSLLSRAPGLLSRTASPQPIRSHCCSPSACKHNPLTASLHKTNFTAWLIYISV